MNQVQKMTPNHLFLCTMFQYHSLPPNLDLYYEEMPYSGLLGPETIGATLRSGGASGIIELIGSETHSPEPNPSYMPA